MGSSTLIDASYSAIKKKVDIYAILDMKGAADPTLMAWTPSTGGVAGSYSAAITSAPTVGGSAGTQLTLSVSRSAQGKFVITPQKKGQRLLFGGAWFSVPAAVNSGLPNCAGAFEITPSGGIDAPGTFSSVTIGTVDFAGALADPTDGSQMKLLLVVDQSGVI